MKGNLPSHTVIRLVLKCLGGFLLLAGIGLIAGSISYHRHQLQSDSAALRQLIARVEALAISEENHPTLPSPSMEESKNWTTSVVNTDPVIETAPFANPPELEPGTSTLEPLPPDGDVEGERAKELEYLKDQPLRIPQENPTSNGDYIPKPLKSQEISLAAVIRVEAGGRTFSFMPVDTSNLPPLGSQSPATRILIPAIDALAPVVPLDLVKDLKGHWSYADPWRREIGRIATAGKPGENARGWYFGHRRTPAPRREEGTFYRLPELVDLLAQGKPVNVILETQQAAYLYQVSGKPVVLTALEFDNGYFHDQTYAAQPEIVLVTCVAALKPDHRLLVVARLVGVGHLP